MVITKLFFELAFSFNKIFLTFIKPKIGTKTNILLPINYNELEVSESSYSKNTDEDEEGEFYDENKENRQSFRSASLVSSLSKKLHINKLKLAAADDADSNNNFKRQIGIDDFDLIKVIGSGSYAKV